MPRVVHLTTVHHLLDPRIFHKEVASLRDAGFDVRLVAQHNRSDVVEGIPVTALTPTRGRYRRLPLLREAYQAARRLGADLYHFHDPELIPVGYALKRATGARVVYDMHEDYRWHGPLEGRLLRGLERWCFTWVDHVVVARASLLRLTRRHGVPATLVANYFKPHPDAAPPGAERDLDGGAVRLLYTGVIAEARGLHALLDLSAALAEEQAAWRLDLVGVCYTQKERERAERRIEQERLGGVLHREGWARYVPSARMTPYYAAAHAGLVLWYRHPNHVDPPTKFYEYLHAGLPLLCSDLPEWRAFIERHGCGVVVDPHDTRAVVAALRRWRSDPALYRRHARAARAAAAQYQWSAMERRLVDLYRRLLAS